MRRPHPDVVLGLAALAAVLALLSASHLLEAPLTPIGAMQEGARVAVEARILEARGRWAMLSDGAHRIGAFVPRGAVVEPGDVVRAEGVVSRGDDGLLLSLDELEVTIPTSRVIRQPSELAARPWDHDGARVVVAGFVRDLHLVGGGARVRLAFPQDGETTWPSGRVGIAGEEAPKEEVVMTGTFRYREADASYVVWVESWTPRS